MKKVPPELVPSYLNRIILSVMIMIIISVIVSAPISSFTILIAVLIGDWGWWNSNDDGDSGYGY
tara:strand:+ start:183 stop:374 length:192 start_codon:yes stop_codon:yes gene_type:complete